MRADADTADVFHNLFAGGGCYFFKNSFCIVPPFICILFNLVCCRKDQVAWTGSCCNDISFGIHNVRLNICGSHIHTK